MNDYKQYLLRQMGLKEAQFVPFIREDEHPDIDPVELMQNAKKVQEENPGMSPDDAKITAKSSMKRDQGPMISPTAITPTIIGVSIRGSSTGGLPSGADQNTPDLSPSKLGGYDRVSPEGLNSTLVNKTPSNPEIKQDSNPINNNPHTGDGVTHPHQMQVTAGEEPQATTGASTDSDPTLQLKSAMPKGIDIDIAETDAKDEEMKNNDNNTTLLPSTSLSETFAKHKKMAMEIVKKHEQWVNENKDKKRICYHCKEPHPCKCDKKDEEDAKLSRDNPEAYRKKFGMKVDKRSDLNESYSSAFERMRGLAGVGSHQVLGKDGLWENVGASEPFNTNFKMDKEKAGYVKVDEEKLKKVKATLERKSKRGTLSDKELQLAKHLNEVLKRRSAKS